MVNPLFFLLIFPALLGLGAYALGKKSAAARDWLVLAGMAVVTACSALGMDASWDLEGVLGLGLHFRCGGLGGVWCVLTSVVWLLAMLSSRDALRHDHSSDRYYLFSLITLGAVQGVFLACDLFSAFACFEVMSLSSYVMVVQEETRAARRAGRAYLAVSVLTGMLSLGGLFLLQSRAGSLDYGELGRYAAAHRRDAGLYIAGGLAALGFAAKAGLFPMHIWLPIAHPEAPAPASALLSGIITKAGVLVVLVLALRLFIGDAAVGTALLMLALVTMLLGGVLALTSVQLKRTLAYSSLSQLGFIMLGVALSVLLGDENALALSGTTGQMINHAIQKLLLFLAAGLIHLKRDSLDLNSIRGYGRGKPVFMACFLVGALSISGVPLGSGFVSKTLLHHAIVELAGHAPVLARATEWLFLGAGALTFAYMTKLFVCIFIERGEGDTDSWRPENIRTAVAMGVAALALIGMGLFPNGPFMRVIGYANAALGVEHFESVHFLAEENTSSALISILVGAVLYVFVARRLLMKGGRYVDPLKGRLDLLNGFYEPLFTKWLPNVLGSLARILDGLVPALLALCKRFVFNKDDERAQPKEDEYFAMYSEKPFLRTGFTDTLAFSFLLMGVGLVAALLYLLF